MTNEKAKLPNSGFKTRCEKLWACPSCTDKNAVAVRCVCVFVCTCGYSGINSLGILLNEIKSLCLVWQLPPDLSVSTPSNANRKSLRRVWPSAVISPNMDFWRETHKMCEYVKNKLVERNKEDRRVQNNQGWKVFIWQEQTERRQADRTQRWIMMEETDKQEVTWIMQHDVSTTRLNDKQ